MTFKDLHAWYMNVCLKQNRVVTALVLLLDH